MRIIMDIDDRDYKYIQNNNLKMLLNTPIYIANTLYSIQCAKSFDSVIEDIKTEIKETTESTFCTKEEAEALGCAILIIDKHISGKAER